MKALPPEVAPYKRTPDFNQDTVPKGLLGEHTTAAGVWGLIKVTKGRLLYRMLEPKVEEHILDAQHSGVVEPELKHQVEIVGDVEFHVEFYRGASV